MGEASCAGEEREEDTAAALESEQQADDVSTSEIASETNYSDPWFILYTLHLNELGKIWTNRHGAALTSMMK